MGDDDRLDEVLAAWCERRDRGEHVDPDELVRAHPELAEGLRARFAAMSALDEIFEESSLSDGVPETIGEYRIVREVGTGGMGTVYLAKDAEDAPIALKVLHPHLLSRPGFFKRFLREAEAGQQVRHGNVVRTLDADAREADGSVVHFLVMEYVEGRTLRQLLDDLGLLPEALLREIARQVTAGLAAIHAAGIVHRDLKPENVLITDDHQIRIMDLGVARLVDHSVVLTGAGQFAGSLHYAAPEQFRGRETGYPADLYSLGVVLYELATGENPFRRDEASAVLGAHLEHVPARAAERNPNLSEFLSEVLATLLEKVPDDRFPSAEDLCEILEAGEHSAWWGERARLLREATPHRPRIPVRRETKLHGRDDDLERLGKAWSEAVAGSGNTVLVEGEAGIGKTRLLDAFLESLDGTDAHVLYGSYPPSGGKGGLADAIREHFGPSDLESALRPYLTVTPTLVPPLAALLRHELPPDDAPSLDGDALSAVLVHLMRSLAAEKPLLWVVDDLHFASADSRNVVLSLARAVEGHRVLLLLTTRPGIPESAVAHFSRLETFQRTQLGRLGARDVIELLAEAFLSDALAEKLGGRIARKSDGIPFFVFEMIRGLKEGQFIAQLPDGSYVETRIVDEIEVPSAVRDLIEARLRDLPDEDRNLLDMAGVLGYEFDPDLVARALGRNRVDVLQRLAAIERRSGVIRSAAGCRFDHHQIQEVVYGDLMPELRREYHALLADAFSEREAVASRTPEDLPGETSVFLATHHLRGTRPAEGLPHLQPALGFLAASYRNEAAIDLAEAALEDPSSLQGADRLQILLRENRLLHMLGRRQAQEEVLAEVRVLAAEIEDRRALAKVETALGMLRWRTGSAKEAIAHFEQVFAIARRNEDRRGEGAAAIGMGNVLSGLGRYKEAREHHERGLAIARETGDRRSEGIATGNLGNVFWALSRYAEAREHHERRLAIARETGDRRSEGTAAGNLGNVCWVLGCFAEAREHYERMLAIAREAGDRRVEGVATGSLGVMFNTLGHNEEARDHYERCRGIACETGDRSSEASALVNLGQMWLTLGDLRSARRDVEASLVLSREIGDRYVEGYAIQGLSDLADAEGAGAHALALACDALTLRRDIGHGGGMAESLVKLARLHHRAQDPAAAREALEEAVILARGQQRWSVVATALALLACLPDGDVETALSALEEAGESGNAPDVHFHLWKATHDPTHLAEAKRRIDYLVEHSPEEYRESMLSNVWLHREIVEAWAEHGGEASAVRQAE